MRGDLERGTLLAAKGSSSATEWNWRRSLGAFGQLPAPPEVPVYPAGAYTRDAPFEVWWPSLADHDVALRRLRARYVGRVVYGYGGIAISCLPNSTRFYSSSTGIRVRSIARENGAVEWLAGGHGTGAPALFGITFLAYAPLVFVVDPPPATVVPEGANYGGIDGMAATCPEFTLADFQVDTKLSLSPPPFVVRATPTPIRPGIAPSANGGTPPPILPGMSRDWVIWTQGYPEELATKAAMLREPVWRYGGAMNQYTTVTFRRNRVVSVHIPPMM